MIDLKDVTLIVVSSIKFEETLFALNESRKNINFFETVLVSHEKPDFYPEDIRLGKCERVKSISEYNNYMIYNLYDHVKSEFALCINYDGYVTNANKWDNDFLNYDYIGAPWPLKDDAYIDPFGNHIRVGNGGFSFRSRKLLNVPNLTNVPFDVNRNDFYKHMGANLDNEDGNICVHNRHIFEKFGCKFAPVEVAARFSRESALPEFNHIETFGFHS